MTEHTEPLVTVCIPSYNHARFVGESIQGILDQTYANIELIIIDDGSSDNSVAVIETYRQACEKRFTRFEIRSRPNKGLSATLNEALEWAQGEYFSPIASDDIALPEKVAVLVAHLVAHPSREAVFGGICKIDDRGALLAQGLPTQPPCREWPFSRIFLGRAMLSAPASVLRMSSLRRVGGFNVETSLEDWDMWLRLSATNNQAIATVDSVVSLYRRHDDNLSKKVKTMHVERMKVISQYCRHPLYIVSVSKFFLVYVRDLTLSKLNLI